MKYFLFILFLPFTGYSQSEITLTKKLDSIFEKIFKADEPGGAVLLVKNDKIIYQKGFGIADIKTREPITTKTLFNVGSITKPFVSYGILKLAEENKLKLDDELYQYFPDFTNKEIARQVRLFHLLTHTSGLPDSRKVKEEHVFYLTARDEENWTPIKQTRKLEFEPGTRYKYSNPAFNGLALIIEKLAGMKWQDYIQKKVFQPAGMINSTITDGPHPATGVAHAYVLNEKKEFGELDYGEEPTFAAAGNGGVWSSVEELWKFEQAIRENKFLTEKSIKKSRTLYPFSNWTDSMPSRLGLSWFLTREMNQPMIGHTGSQGGFISDYCWFPDTNIFYVLLCNTPKPIKDIRVQVLKTLQ